MIFFGGKVLHIQKNCCIFAVEKDETVPSTSLHEGAL